MSPSGPARTLARLALRLYPRSFRREVGPAYLEAAAHRWGRDYAPEAGKGGMRHAWAGLRFLGFLVRDALGAAPAAWMAPLRGSRSPIGGHGPGGRGPGRGSPGRWLESWVWDGRVALRSLVRRPGPALTIVAILALGIGANVAIFGVLDRVVLNPFPFPDGGRMAYVVDRNAETGFSVSPTQEEVERWREEAGTLEALEILRAGSGTLVLDDGDERVSILGVSYGMTSMVRLRPVVGRAFVPGDARDGPPAAVMLHEDFWRRGFGADPAIVGRVLRLLDRELTVVGVWPAAARLRVQEAPDLVEVLPRGREVDRSMFTQALVLLRPGVDPAQAEAELRAIRAAMDRESEAEPSRYVPTLRAPHQDLGPAFSRGVWVLFVGVWLLLLGAAVNGASLLLDRAVDREAELGVRLALGGSGGRLLRVFVLEGLLLVGAAAGLGLLLARAGGAALASVAPDQVPASLLEGVGGRVPLYALALLAATTLVCAAVPAFHLRSPRVRRLLGAGQGARRDRGLLRSTLVAAQVGLAVVLLVGSALTVRSFRALYTMDPGFALRELVTVGVRAPASRFPSEADRSAALQRAEAALAALPGVRGVDGSGTSLLSYSMLSGEPRLEGDGRVADGRSISATTGAEEDFFDVLGIPLLEGRTFTAADRRPGAAPVVVVNDVFSDRYTGGVLGRSLLMREGDTLRQRVVGVVGSVSAFGLGGAGPQVQVYLPEPPRNGRFEFERFNLRLEGDPDGVLALARERIRSLNPGLVVSEARTGAALLRSQTADQRFLAVLLIVFGGVALLLAVGGVYGALSLHVARHTRDLGVRIALGADRVRLLREVVALGLRPVLLGAGAGTALAALLSRHLEGVLYQVSPVDPASFAAGAVLLLLAAVAALLLPARRAARVEPVEALRVE